MTDAELSALEAAAKAATPGPWEHGKKAVLWMGDEKNKAFVAAAKPSTILSLIAELRQAKAERDFILEQIDDIFDTDDLLEAAKEATCQKN